MKIVFNGQTVELPNTHTLSALLTDSNLTKGLSIEQAVVAVNQTLVHKSDYETLIIHEGDQIEMLTAVVGG
ncbi:hypothetical protein NBRC116188_20340 [Oceaniserpentilla sp. 4NH20-0058]|uniref:sulfur carrier protein ThiS n=1 Tax=Oceaniserpentilla sp. 4NH20-0058 TaxID=3127660 RepID=UPI00310A34A4